MSSLSKDQINELIINAESEDDENDWFSDGGTSDSELESDSFENSIREKLVSKLCSTPVSTSNTLSSQVTSSELISNIQNISYDDNDMYCLANSPNISINRY